MSQTNPNANVVDAGNQQKANSKLMLLVAGIGVVGILVGLVGMYLYMRRSNNTQAEATAASPTPSPIPTMSDRAQQIEEKILRGETLSGSDIAGLSAYELRVLRNVHFARYGRKYERPGLGDYFYTRSWYKPIDSYNDNSITSTDKTNINLILAVEKGVSGSPALANSQPASSSSPTDEFNTGHDPNAGEADYDEPEEQAKNALRKHFEPHFSKCGDSYFAWINHEITPVHAPLVIKQFKNPSFALSETYPLTEANKLNGVTYSAQFEFRSSAARILQRGSWSSWFNYRPTLNWSFNVAKVNGKWQIRPAFGDGIINIKKVECSELAGNY